MLWEFNRLLPEKPCQTGTLVRLIDVELLATICVILPPAPSVLQEGSSEGSSDACVYTRGSVRRASGFLLTGNPEVRPRNNFQRRGPEVGLAEIIRWFPRSPFLDSFRLADQD